MQHIILGINAHINLDLGVSAAAIMPYRKVNLLQNDFNKINEVIASINQKVQDSLSKICYPVQPVSYTHLDVYKRQASFCWCGSNRSDSIRSWCRPGRRPWPRQVAWRS